MEVLDEDTSNLAQYLISLNLSFWTIMRSDVDFPDEDEEPGFEQLQ
jgi:hypothetical protein